MNKFIICVNVVSHLCIVEFVGSCDNCVALSLLIGIGRLLTSSMGFDVISQRWRMFTNVVKTNNKCIVLDFLRYSEQVCADDKVTARRFAIVSVHLGPPGFVGIGKVACVVLPCVMYLCDCVQCCS